MSEKHITKHCKQLNREIKYVHNHKASICIPKLHCNSLKNTIYIDLAFATTAEISSQLERIFILTDDSPNYIPVSFRSCKSRCVTRSGLSAEVIALADLFDNALAIRKQLEFSIRQPISVQILTDSKSLFDIITKEAARAKSELSLTYIRLDMHIKHNE